MTQNGLSDNIKYIPVYSLTKSVKYMQNISIGRKLFKSWACLISIWAGVIFGVLFPLFVWTRSINMASKIFHVDVNWILVTFVICLSVSFFSNMLYLIVKLFVYLVNYLSYGNIHTNFRPLSDGNIDKISKVGILVGDRIVYLSKQQVIYVQEKLIQLMKNKVDKEKVKTSYEMFIKGDVMDAMYYNPIVSYTISKSFREVKMFEVASIIRDNITNISMVTSSIKDPEQTNITSRLKRLKKQVENFGKEIDELETLIEDAELFEFDDKTISLDSVEIS